MDLFEDNVDFFFDLEFPQPVGDEVAGGDYEPPGGDEVAAGGDNEPLDGDDGAGGDHEPPGGDEGGRGPTLNVLLEPEMDRLRRAGHLSEKLIKKVQAKATLTEKGKLLRAEIWYFIEKAFVEFMRFTMFRWNDDVEWYEEARIADKIQKLAERIGSLGLASSARTYAYHCRGNDRNVDLRNPTHGDMRQNLLTTQQELLTLWELSGEAARNQGA